MITGALASSTRRAKRITTHAMKVISGVGSLTHDNRKVALIGNARHNSTLANGGWYEARKNRTFPRHLRGRVEQLVVPARRNGEATKRVGILAW